MMIQKTEKVLGPYKHSRYSNYSVSTVILSVFNYYLFSFISAHTANRISVSLFTDVLYTDIFNSEAGFYISMH